jgi:hypothetical protein
VRLRLFAVLALAVSLAVATAAAYPRSQRAMGSTRVVNPIPAENARQGTTAWIGRVAPPGAVDAYTSEVSVQPGGTIHLHIATDPAAPYRVEIYRLGWYGGAGGRLMGCVPSCTGSRPGVPQTNPGPDSGTGLLQLDWPVTDTIAVGRDWVSGYYYLNVVLAGGAAAGTLRHVPVIVTAPPNRLSLILAQASVNTWQAYNAWGGMSLYTKPGTTEGSHVSFDRPYDTYHQGPRSWELAAVHFLERHGYNVSYTTDADTDLDPSSLLRHALVMTLGHDEYWTHTMRDAYEQARDAGINLAFLGANDGYWQIRYGDDHRTLVEYRHPDLDPEPSTALKTTTFRELNPPRPECQLFGVEYGQIGDSQDFTVNTDALSDAWFAGTGFVPGNTLHGLVGYEWDGVLSGCPLGTPPTVFFHNEKLNGLSPVEGSRWNADVTRYVAPSGARVFAGGSLQFAWGLDPTEERYDARLDRFMRNALDDLTRPASPTAVGVTARPRGVIVAVPDPHSAQVAGIVVYRHPGNNTFGNTDAGVARIAVPHCRAFLDRPGPGHFRYAVAYTSRWRTSLPTLGPAVTPVSGGAPGTPAARPRCVRGLR